MNERLKQLAIECNAWEQVYNPHKFMVDRTFDVEKFANLIVEECADIADEYDGVGSTIVSRIKKHFGN
jgi:hypothetical protein